MAPSLLIPSSHQHWLYRYKLYHLPFWFAYHFTWWTITIGSPWQVLNNLLFSPFVIKFLFYVVFQAIAVYFNLYYLIPRLLERGRFVSYTALLMLTVLCTAAFIVPGYYLTAWWSGRPFVELFNHPAGDFMFFFKTNSLPSTVASTTLAMSVKLTRNWIVANRRQQLLEKEKLETELKFLKSQFNPHFLFNTINSIFVLIHKNPHVASDSLAKFSDLLRYQLYECNEHRISLQQEVSYLENFIELERLRQEKDLSVSCVLDKEQLGAINIAPFVLMPFVENAFKHVSHRRDRQNWISITLQIQERELVFAVSNSVSRQPVSATLMVSGGIGLKNVQRRLDLIYPERHTLTIRETDNEFHVHLSLQLHAQPMPASVAV